MRYHDYGDTGLLVSEIGVGGSRLGGMFAQGTSTRDEIDLLRAALDAGVTFFDTSDLYSHGQSEILVGKAIKGRREHAIVATKGGFVVPARLGLLGRAKPLLRPVARALRLRRPGGAGVSGVATQTFSSAYLVSAVEASLRRLGTDYIDIYQLHSPPRSVVEAGEFVAALDRLKVQGKIRAFGVAVEEADDAVGFDRFPSITSVQVPFSLIDRRAARTVLPAATSSGAGVISRSCFAAGLLVGDVPATVLRERTPDWRAILSVRAAALELGRPMKELALKFNAAHEPIAVTVIGMKTRAHLHEALAGAAAPPLTTDELDVLVHAVDEPQPVTDIPSERP